MKDNGFPAVTIAIPAYNEEANLGVVVADLLATVSTFLSDFEVLIVDDGSTDRTGMIADELQANSPAVRVIHHGTNRGFSGAMLSSVMHAAKDFVLLMPGDGQARVRDIEPLMQKASRYDLVFSSRLSRSDVHRRKVASALWYGYVSLMFGYRIRQFSSLFLFRRSAILDLELEVNPAGATFLFMLYALARRRGASIGWVATDQPARLGGHSKGDDLSMAARTAWECFLAGLRFRFERRSSRRRLI